MPNDWEYVSDGKVKRLCGYHGGLTHQDGIDLVHTLQQDREKLENTNRALATAIAERAQAGREADENYGRLARVSDEMATRLRDRIKDLVAQVNDLCEREDPGTAPIVRRLREELERDKATIERQSLSLEVAQKDLDAEKDTSARLRRANEALAGIEGRLDAEREMAVAARTEAGRLEGIVAEKERETEALREALETRMLGQCDHETRLIFHVAGDVRVVPPDIPVDVEVVEDTPLRCRSAECTRSFASVQARNVHEGKTHGGVLTPTDGAG